MNTLKYNNGDWFYEYKQIASPNSFAPAVYVTRLYIGGVTGNYFYEEMNGRMTEEDIRLFLDEKVRGYEHRKYGQQRSTLRKDLTPRRSRQTMRYLH